METDIAYVALFPNGPDCVYQPERLPEADAHNLQATPEEALQVFDFHTTPLQLTGDVVSQRLVCYFPP